MKSNSYKRAMDKITVSDELRDKILQSACDMPKKSVRPKTFYIKYGVGLAACLAVLIVSSLLAWDSIFVDKELPSGNVAVKTEDDKNEVTEEKDKPKEISTPNKEESEKQITYESYDKTETEPVIKVSEPENNEDTKDLTSEDAAINDYTNSNYTDGFEGEEFFVMSSNPFADEIDSLKVAQEKVEYDVKAPTFMPKGYEIDNITLTDDDGIRVTYQNDYDFVTYSIGDAESEDNPYINRYSVVRTEDVNGITVTLKGNGNIYNDIEWNDGKSYWNLLR